MKSEKGKPTYSHRGYKFYLNCDHCGGMERGEIDSLCNHPHRRYTYCGTHYYAEEPGQSECPIDRKG